MCGRTQPCAVVDPSGKAKVNVRVQGGGIERRGRLCEQCVLGLVGPEGGVHDRKQLRKTSAL